MTAHERLHHFVDSAPESELPRAERALLALSERDFGIADCPLDDEPETPGERCAVDEAWVEHRRGEGLSTAELRSELSRG